MPKKDLSERCDGCGFVRGRHSMDGACPKSSKKSHPPWGNFDMPDGQRFVFKGEYMKRRKFKEIQ
jgi:hypothetical protein